jgi:dihydrofolate reductase
MRRIRYQVACSLDGYIAGPQGEADWIVDEPGIDFGALFAQFATLLMGRRTYEAMQGQAGGGSFDQKVLVFSSTLRPEEHPRGHGGLRPGRGDASRAARPAGEGLANPLSAIYATTYG